MTTTTPKVQKAWRVVTQGTPSQAIVLANDVPVIRPDPGEVLVKIQAAALNPVGPKVMATVPNFFARRPHTAENDFAGVVAESNDPEFKVGDEVLGWIPTALQQKSSQGALAEYIRMPVSHIVKKPDSLNTVQAAGVSLAGLTAWQALSGIKSGQHIFINGGSSSVGSSAIQIAKSRGCKVTASASATSTKIVKGLGADMVIDYQAVGSLHKYLATHPPTPLFDVIFDCIGIHELYTSSPAYLTPGGIFITVGPDIGASTSIVSGLASVVSAKIRPTLLGGVPRKYSFIMVKNSKKDLQELCALIDQGKYKPLIDSEYQFDQVLHAYDRLISKRAKGKVVIHIS